MQQLKPGKNNTSTKYKKIFSHISQYHYNINILYYQAPIIVSFCDWKKQYVSKCSRSMFCLLRAQSQSPLRIWSEDWLLPTRWRLKCTDEVRHFIGILLWSLQHTIAAVTSDGLGPGRKIKENDIDGKSERGSPNQSKLTDPWATTASATGSLCCNSHSSGPNGACTQTLC